MSLSCKGAAWKCCVHISSFTILIATHQPLNVRLHFLTLSKWGCYPFCSLKKVSQFIVSILKLMAVDRISKGGNFVWPSSSEFSVNSWRGHPPWIFAVNHGFILLLDSVVICQMHFPFIVKILYKRNHEFVWLLVPKNASYM